MHDNFKVSPFAINILTSSASRSRVRRRFQERHKIGVTNQACKCEVEQIMSFDPETAIEFTGVEVVWIICEETTAAFHSRGQWKTESKRSIDLILMVGDG